ncbi:NAD(P)H-hydrate dehydratase [Sulfurimonas sp.]|uniref:NAD(P)H-hydrate dehydratase n=1 Tax=Sulfurimonas sp. TaxID=2022749 RepID=UPI0025E45985|nr:NAD(P)H-hydrate dehydratase [Sulfurimonas sp.]MDD5157986.1 NAD(P)H-hydrate dehydratase [Sulfurimonas sp.]
MQNLFDEVVSLDRRCYEEFFLSEDLLMEHAAGGMAAYIRENFPKNSKIIVVCGASNNGADGLALARILHGDYAVSIFYANKPKSAMALLQEKRAKSIGVRECREIEDCAVLVDAIFGTGFGGELSTELSILIEKMNQIKAFKIACDIPSAWVFKADVTLTMGALKKSMFLDETKERIGEIKVIDLGVSRSFYETKSNWRLLDLGDIKLPNREKQDVHKGNYGHLAIASGSKIGAGVISGLSALRFGSGLVTLVGYENPQIPHTLMYSHELPKNSTALAIGMGLGEEFSIIELDKFLDNNLPLIGDADIFYMPILLEILKRQSVVLTPHPKEFISLLKMTNIADISVEVLQKNRFFYAEKFCAKFPTAVLLLKGANVIIGKDGDFFVNPHGTSALAKGGSGDVLSGLIGALLAQGYTPLDSAINGSLAHALLSKNYDGVDFSLTPDELISGIGKLK